MTHSLGLRGNQRSFGWQASLDAWFFVPIWCLATQLVRK